MKRIVTVVGARPQFVKAAAVSRVLRADTAFKEVLVHTGQHYDENMSDIFFSELNIPAPDHCLEIGSFSHGKQTGRMLEALESVILSEHADGVLVYGDTNSTLAGALAAVKLCVPVLHVEAGLRSGDRRMPEEINRIVADHCSDVLFAPTIGAVENLRREGIPAKKIFQVGDVMYDVALYYGSGDKNKSQILNTLSLIPGQYILATIHRAENTDDIQKLSAILEGLSRLAREIAVVVPLHPRTRAVLSRHPELTRHLETLRVIDPVGYLDMLQLEKNAACIATDSGGVQKEAFFFKVPCVTLRPCTEWGELIEMGWNRLASATADLIYTAVRQALGTHGRDSDVYGAGEAGKKITEILKTYFEKPIQ